MQIRIIIIGDDNQTHPYEFNSYEDAVNFLNDKKPRKEVDEVVDEIVEEAPVEVGTVNIDETKECVRDEGDGKEEGVEEDKKKEDLLVE